MFSYLLPRMRMTHIRLADTKEDMLASALHAAGKLRHRRTESRAGRNGAWRVAARQQGPKARNERDERNHP